MMNTPRIESGVAAYIIGKHTVKVGFPVDFTGRKYIRCEYCEYFRRTSRICGLNGHVPAFPERNIGQECPLQFEEDFYDGKP